MTVGLFVVVITATLGAVVGYLFSAAQARTPLQHALAMALGAVASLVCVGLILAIIGGLLAAVLYL